MRDYLHWHRTGDEPSVCVEPPPCCMKAVEDVWHRRVDTAVHDERRRIILEAVAAATTYAEAAASVLEGERAQLVTTAMTRMIKAVKRTGCICPLIDVHTLNEAGPRYIRGGDSRCGMHEVSP